MDSITSALVSFSVSDQWVEDGAPLQKWLSRIREHHIKPNTKAHL